VVTEAVVEKEVYRQFVCTTGERAVTFFELGAGHGFQAMAFLDCLNRCRTMTAVETVFCVLVEPYPPHFEPLRRNFGHQACKIIHGAVAHQAGRRRFHSQWAGVSGPEFWGGFLSANGDIEVDTHTLPDIMALASLDRITLLHMDIQGEEEDIAGDCLALFRMGKLENIYIGTHGEQRHRRVRAMLEQAIPLRLDAPPDSVSETPLGTVQTLDGILYFSLLPLQGIS
jgi:FkbM family methyltransferase